MPTIHARHPSGFLVTLDDIDRNRIDDAVAWLIEHSYRPDPPVGDPWQRTPSGEPLCPRHGVVMARREKQGNSWYSHRVIHPETGQELFCKGFPNPTSAVDGYHV